MISLNCFTKVSDKLRLELWTSLNRRYPAEYSHRNSIWATHISVHLLFQILERVEAQKVIESLLIVSVAAFNLSVVPWRSWANKFVVNSYTFTKAIKGMCTATISGISKFKTIISLDDFRLIPKVGYCTFYKVNCTVAALFTIWINETFSWGLINHRILIELIRHFTDITGTWKIFDIKLPFYT